MFGELSNVSVGGMLRFLTVYRQTGRLKVRGKEGEGEIYLEEGNLVGTGKGGKLRGEVLRLLMLRQGTFHFEALKSIPEKNRQAPEEEVENYILEASRFSEPDDIADFLPPEEATLQLAPIHGERAKLRLELQRDEWNFLTQINGEDSLGILLEKSGLRKTRAQQIAYGFLSAGLVRKIRFQIPKVMEIATRELGNMGEALVRQAFRKLKLDPARMRMRQLIDLLNELEKNISLLLGPTRASQIIHLMWEGSKR